MQKCGIDSAAVTFQVLVNYMLIWAGKTVSELVYSVFTFNIWSLLYISSTCLLVELSRDFQNCHWI